MTDLGLLVAPYDSAARVARVLRSPSTDRVDASFSARFHPGRSGMSPDGTLVGGLRMTQADDNTGGGFSHTPVMLEEVVELLAPVPPGVVLDATVGGGGHAQGILSAHPHLSVVGMDQDPAAVDAATSRLASFGSRAKVVRGRFDGAARLIDDMEVPVLSAALFDLGVSSPQLDRSERGFSYRQPAPLDMRMDPDSLYSAADLVNSGDEVALSRLFVENGEGRFARRIARAMVTARPIVDTVELAEVIRAAIPAATRRQGGHPAKRVFQALRIAVNDELNVLSGALGQVLDRLVIGGRCIVLSYHSGEDRLVKTVFVRSSTGGCICPPGLPCVCGAAPEFRLLNRGARKPTAHEVELNRRSQSARLRAVERVAARDSPADVVSG